MRRLVVLSLRSLFGLLLLSFLLLAVPAFGQTSNTGAIGGTVTDSTGAVVPGTRVQATNRATNQVNTAVSQASGVYVIPLLPPGDYTVSASSSGFKISSYPDVRVKITETQALNIELQVGAKGEQVVVTATAEQLQTESSSLGQVTDGITVRSLPLVTRNYTQIIGLNPGVNVEVTNAGALGRGPGGTTDAGMAVNGNTAADNNYQMNGVGINDLESSGGMSGGVAIPNPDTIVEFKVQTGQYDASYGRNAGASVDVVTKGGSNALHGSLWEFFRNDVLNANTYFRNLAGQSKPVLKQNQFGFVLGGPIKKDKLFFFGSYQGTRQRNGLDSSCLSQVTSAPLTNDRSQAALGALFAGQRGVIQDLFGGVGPAIAADGSNISAAALALLQRKLPSGGYVIPTPQVIDTNQPFDSQGFSSFSIPCPYTENQYMANADYQQSAKSKFSVRFFAANSQTTESLPANGAVVGSAVPGSPVALTSNYRNFSLSHDYIFSTALINQAVLGFHRTYALFNQSDPFQFSDIGVTVPAFDNQHPVISLDYTGQSGPMTLGGNGQTVRTAQNTYTLQDTLTWIRGRHTLRLGAGFSYAQDNVAEQYFGGLVYLSWARCQRQIVDRHRPPGGQQVHLQPGAALLLCAARGGLFPQLSTPRSRWRPAKKSSAAANRSPVWTSAGQKLTLWTDDANGIENQGAYKPVPFFMSSRGYGMFLHTTTPITLDFGHDFSGVNSMMIGDDELDLFVFLGTPKEILDEYTKLTGKSPMPPLWSFGLWMSRCTYNAETQVREIAGKLRENKIPCDVLHLDTGWFETDWQCDYEFSTTRFTDPKKMLADLKADGFRVSCWQLPYFVPKNKLFSELVEKNLVVRDAKGNLPYEDAVLDFSNPKTVEWYQGKLAGLLSQGVSAIKVDFGEAAPDKGIYANGRTGFYEHNLYPLRYNKAVAEITSRPRATTLSGRAARGPAASGIRCTGAATRKAPMPAWRRNCAADCPLA